MAYPGSKNGLLATNGHSQPPNQALQLTSDGAFRSTLVVLGIETSALRATTGGRPGS